MDLLNVVIRADTSGSDRAAESLDQMAGAARQADAAVKGVGSASAIASGAIGQSAVATDRATASSRARAGALQAEAAASRMASMNSRQLSYQLIDIGQSIPLLLQSPVHGLQNIGFQVAQIGQLFMGQGGLNAALSAAVGQVGRFALAFAPLALAAGAVVGVFAGLTYEINKTSDVTVSFGDVFVASMQLAAESIGAFFAPAITQLGSWMAQFWDYAWPIWKDNINGIIGAFVGAYEAVKQAWGNLPTFFSAIGKEAWNNLVSEFEKPALTWGDQVIIPGFDLTDWKAKLTDAERAAKGAATVTFNAAQRDFVGGGMGALSDRSQELALQRIAEEAEETGKALKGANDNGKELEDTLAAAARAAKEEWDFFRGTFSGFFSDLKSGIQQGQSLWESFGNAASTALDKIASRAMDMAANGLFDMLFGAVMGGLGGGGFSPQLGQGLTGASVFGGGGGFYGIPGLATGGTVRTGGMAWVGEKGPELVSLPRGAQVIPHGPSMSMAGSSKGPVQIDISISVDESGNIVPMVRQVAGEQADLRVRTFVTGGEMGNAMDKLSQHKRLGR